METGAEKVRQAPLSGSSIISACINLKGGFVPGMVARSVSLWSAPKGLPSIVTESSVSASFLVTSETVKRYTRASSVLVTVTLGLSPSCLAVTIFATSSALGASLSLSSPHTVTRSGAEAVMSVEVIRAVKSRACTR